MPAGAAVTSDAVMYLPGILGSELVDGQGRVRWGMSAKLLARQALFGGVLRALIPRPDDDIRASRPIQLPVTLPLLSGIEPYTNLDRRLRASVSDPLNVSAFAYDWRRSIADAAAQLAPAARQHLDEVRARYRDLSAEERRKVPEPRLTLVGHSMGGLVASYFATVLADEGGSEVKRVITLGTPFGGSLNPLKVLSSGRYLPFGLFASSLREAARTMPGFYELIASFRCVEEGDEWRTVDQRDLVSIQGDAEIAEPAAAVMTRLRDALEGADGDLFRCLVGTTQPTAQSVRFRDGEAELRETIRDDQGEVADHRGDGTVFRYAAAPPGVPPLTLPQSHGAVAKSNEGIQFAADAATERKPGAFQATTEVGLRAPEVVELGQPFEVEVLDQQPGLICQVIDAESGRVDRVAPLAPRDGRMVAEVVLRQPGLHAVQVAAGGFSPVVRHVLALDDGSG